MFPVQLCNHSFNIFDYQSTPLKRLLPAILMLFCFSGMYAQTPADSLSPVMADTTLHADSLRLSDSLQSADTTRFNLSNDSVMQLFQRMPGKRPNEPFLIHPIDWELYVIKHNSPDTAAEKPFSPSRNFEGKDFLFYGLVLLLLFFALIRNSFPKYFSDLFRLFFRTTIKQSQIREQLMQTPLPSLLFNGLFVVSGGLYLAFIAQHFKLGSSIQFWLIFIYGCLGLSAVYFLKFLGLKFTGWLFQQQDAASSYIFIVFIVNKMIGILLLPFLVILAFAKGELYSAGILLSVCLLGGLLVYRFVLTYAVVRNQVRVNPFHFFLYLCAFEIAPLFLIYKGLLLFFEQST